MHKQILLVPALLACALPLAQAEDRNAAMEETVVTATFRATQLSDTAGSVSVLGQSIMQERAARHLEDILSAAPNVTYSAGTSRSRFVQIRGVGDLEQYYDPKSYPSVGLMLDQLELGDSANAGMLFDVAQVEVLRGPQGTRFGSSAHAGMVQIRSNRPTSEFEGRVTGGVGDYDSYNLGLVLSGPLAESVRGRFAVQQNASDGYIENDRVNADDVNEFDELTARTRLEWQATPDSLYELSVLYFDADNGHDAWSLDNNRTTQSDQPGQDNQETLSAALSGKWQLGATHSLQAVVSHTDTDLFQSYDADWVSDQLCEQTPCSGGNDTAQERFGRERKRNILDLRLLGGNTLEAGDGRYVLGVYANDSEEDFDYDYPSIWYGDSALNSDYETTRVAVYGEYEYALTESFTLAVSARLEQFEDDYSDSNGFESDNSEDLLNLEVSARYHLSDNTLIYATVAQGEKPGGINTTASANAPSLSPQFQEFMGERLAYDEETLLNKEIGIKTRLLDGRATLNLAAFHTDRDNAQLENWMWDGDSGLWIGFLDTNGDATTWGLELESNLVVSERLELFARLGWLDTEVDSIDTFDLDENAFVTKRDRDQAKSPEYQFNVGTRFNLSEAISGTVEVVGQDDVFFGYYHDGQLDSYELVHGSLRWANDTLAITLWGRNLTDEDYAVHGLYFAVDPRDDFGAFANQTYTQLGEPRTWGVDVSYDF